MLACISLGGGDWVLNCCLLAAPASTIQRTQYYPSGLPWKSSTADGAALQPYKYGGKEFIETHGLDEYYSYARNVYPAILRTSTLDLHAESYYSISPYVWCGNNPVNRVDMEDGAYKNWGGWGNSIKGYQIYLNNRNGISNTLHLRSLTNISYMFFTKVIY